MQNRAVSRGAGWDGYWPVVIEVEDVADPGNEKEDVEGHRANFCLQFQTGLEG